MTNLLLDRGLYKPEKSRKYDAICTVAKSRTLSAFRSLDGEQKGRVLRFLYESGLINREKPIINLGGADLREAYLQEAHLEGAHIEKADLDRAILRGAILKKAHLQGTLLRCADLDGADVEGAHLERADLEGAILRRVNLEMAHGLDSSSKREWLLHTHKRDSKMNSIIDFFLRWWLYSGRYR